MEIKRYMTENEEGIRTNNILTQAYYKEIEKDNIKKRSKKQSIK